PEDAQTASGLIEKVRHALARSKREGKNRTSRDVGLKLPTEKEALEQFHRPRLMARERDVERCQMLFEQAPAGHNLCILIEGEHGLGKSRFLAELPGLARETGLRFIQGGCLAQNQAVPYSALTPWLQEYFDRSPDAVAPIAARLSGPKLAALASLLAVLKPSEGGGETISGPMRRGLLFHGMLDLLCLMVETAPLVVLLENLQWADEASLEVLLHLLSRDDGKLVVCGTAVTDVLDAADSAFKLRSLPDFLPYFQESPHFHRVTLSPLTHAQVGELAADILRHPVPGRFQQLLWEVSRGVPLLVEETLKGLITRGTLREEEGAWNFEQMTPEDFPASAEEAIARRLEILEPETLEVVSEASVIGRDVDLAVLAEVLGQDPGETLQLVDRGRRSGLFERIDPLADPGDIRFANASLQKIVYNGLDVAHRRQTHRKVAEVYERLASPGSDEALGPLSYHFERSDDTGKAGVYREKVRALRDWLFSASETREGKPPSRGGAEPDTVKVRIPEATQLLGEHTLPLAVQFAKVLTLAAKNRRVFPEGSQLVREAVAGATAALVKLLEQVDAVTLAEHHGALLVNGQAAEGKAVGAVAQDLLRLFGEHGIRSVTFVRGVAEPEVDQVVKILGGPPQGIPAEISPWEELLASRGILHAGVFPAIYVAATRRATETPQEVEAPLDDEALRLAAEVFRSLAASVDNLRLYPPENELNLLIQERLERQAQALLGRIPVVTLALADDTIVINGARPNPKWFGLTIPLLHKLMQDNGLTSLTLFQGVTRADLGVFLAELARPREEDPGNPFLWEKLLADHGIATIQVGTRFYAAARALLTAGDERRAAGLELALTEEERLFQQAARWLDDPTAPAFHHEAILPALESWLGSEREDLARRLLDRITGGLANPTASIRQRAATGLHLLFTKAPARTLSWLLRVSLEPLENALLKETSLPPFQAEVSAAAEALKLLAKAGDLTRAAGLAEALGRAQAAKPDHKELLHVAVTAVEGLAEAGAFQPVLVALRGSDPASREQGKAVLTALGEGILRFLVNVVALEESEEVRKVAATLLRSLPGAGLRLLVPQLRPPASGELSRRIVSALDILAPELGPDFFFLLAHPDVLVRAELAGVVSRLPRAAAVRFLGRALGEPQPEILAGALECVRAIQAMELLEATLQLLKRGAPPEVLKAACLCLGHLKDQRGVRPLAEILQRRPRFLGLVKGLPDTVRAAAARALGDLPFPEAQEGLRAVLKDSSLAVRSTARLALSRLQQGREPR
ncbi:MAG: AAA family ATPase, partial [Candidatus Rokubacteria bacterium]|nr:AAA family ATPase [Candidatus Rokubacteria bacterium]